MKGRDLLVTNNGQCQACKSPREWDLICDPYRLYRFLTEVEDVVDQHTANESDGLPQIRLLVRKLVLNCYWIHTRYPQPDPKTGSAVLMLYDELGFPMTVQTETTLPAYKTPAHNHGTWGVVAVIKGEEKHTFWQHTPSPKFPDKITPVGEVTLIPGDIISFTPEAIHTVEVIGEEPTFTFNIYGETHHSQRFEFDPLTATAKKF